MDPLVTIISDSDSLDFTAGALPRRVNVTTYMVGELGPYSVRIPTEQATADAIGNAIQTKVNMLRQLGAIQ